MNQEQAIEYLDGEWDRDTGFLGKLRSGEFDGAVASVFCERLKTIGIPEEGVKKRLVSLLWYVPLFLHWQADRVSEYGGDVPAYKMFTTQVENILEEVLGVP